MSHNTGSNTRQRLQRMKNSGLISNGNQLKTEKRGQLSQLFPGEEWEEVYPEGSCYYRETSINLKHKHGCMVLEYARECTGNSLQLLMANSSEDSSEMVNPCQGLFLDLETTGLAGGTGTWAFLVGAGWIEENQLRVRQYFLRHPREERFLLQHFVNSFREYHTLISFNGKTFDLPLFHTRQVIHGVTPFMSPSMHVDLLYCSRRFWKDRLPSCSLQSLEENVLLYRREGDIPGEEIPGVYFQYLRQGETSRLKKVFEHNRLDIITMVALLGTISKLEKKDFLDTACPEDCYALGLLLWKKGYYSRAEKCLRKAAEKGSRRQRCQAYKKLGFLYKHLKDWEASVSCWKLLLEDNSYDLEAYVELAKIYEHRLKNLAKALQITREAISLASRYYQMGGARRELTELRHRLNRIERKSSS